MLTNKPKSFYKSYSFVTGLSDYHRLIVSILRTSFEKLPPKFVTYRNQKNFHESDFLRDLDSKSYTKTANIHILKCLKYFLKF